MNVVQITEYLTENKEKIGDVLEEAGFANVTFKNNEYRCARDYGRNPTSIKVDANTLSSACFSTGIFGNLYTILQEKLGINFPQSLQFVCKTLNLDYSYNPKKIKLPFGGYYKKIRSYDGSYIANLETYDKSILEKYEMVGNKMFLEDGISLETQRKYNVGYDLETDRIIVPWQDTVGNIVGVMGRKNEKECEEYKWLPVIAFPKSQTLFGYYQNYSKIQENKILFIGESEKFTMQLDSMGNKMGVSTGTSYISDVQSKYIKSLYAKNIIICYDEGLDEELIRVQAKKLVYKNTFFKNRVGYIYDKNNEILPKGEKDSPSDLGKEEFKLLLKNHVVWL